MRPCPNNLNNPTPTPAPFHIDSIATPAGLRAYLDAKGFDSNFFRKTLRDIPLTAEELSDVLAPPQTSRPIAPQRRQTNPPRGAPECAQMCTNVPECATPPHSCKTNPPVKMAVNPAPPPPAAPLSPRQLHAAQLLLAGHTGKSVAAVLQVNPHTISGWKKLPAFQNQLHRLLQRSHGPAPQSRPSRRRTT